MAPAGGRGLEPRHPGRLPPAPWAAPNDPAQSQYQLWIVDPARDPEFKVNGGVFDVPDGDGEALVRLRPRRPVGRPVAFVIPRE